MADDPWQLPVDYLVQTFGRDGKMVTEYAIVGSNLREWCRCTDEGIARYIVCAVNQMPRVPIPSQPLSTR